MSPPEPLTQSTGVGLPVNGSSCVSLAEVLPPPKLVTRLSAPSRFERYSSSSGGLSWRAWLSSHRLGSSRESASDGSSAVLVMRRIPLPMRWHSSFVPSASRRWLPGALSIKCRSNLVNEQSLPTRFTPWNASDAAWTGYF